MNRTFDFLLSIAKSYYIGGMTQSEIASRYKISRPTVASILKECKTKGIVEIHINDNSTDYSPLAQQLVKTYGLQTASIIPNEKDDISTLTKTCRNAALFFSSFLKDRLRMGLGWGISLYYTIQALEHSPIKDAEVIQLMGGFGGTTKLPDGSELARILASKLNARCFVLLAPLFVKSESFKKSLLSEKGIQETYERTKNLDIAMVGISSDDPKESRLLQAGYISPREAFTLFNSGSCCDFCGYHFDEYGHLMDISANKRVVGIEPRIFLNIPRRIGIACGKPKANAIRAALRGKLITDLFTDETTASLILK